MKEKLTRGIGGIPMYVGVITCDNDYYCMIIYELILEMLVSLRLIWEINVLSTRLLLSVWPACVKRA